MLSLGTRLSRPRRFTTTAPSMVGHHRAASNAGRHQRIHNPAQRSDSVVAP
ncbi:hypothetical protein BN2364_0542 [Alloalcanivorax xenomutans]|nr:hypothetical protein BN2364_0542 [Alloalcanivorax xenomutans]